MYLCVSTSVSINPYRQNRRQKNLATVISYCTKHNSQYTLLYICYLFIYCTYLLYKCIGTLALTQVHMHSRGLNIYCTVHTVHTVHIYCTVHVFYDTNLLYIKLFTVLYILIVQYILYIFTVQMYRYARTPPKYTCTRVTKPVRENQCTYSMNGGFYARSCQQTTIHNCTNRILQDILLSKSGIYAVFSYTRKRPRRGDATLT